MAYYYVKSGGTAGNTNAGRTTTKRTGAWSGSTGDYYDNIQQVFGISAGSGTNPVAGDTVFVSDSHAHTYTNNVVYGVSGVTGQINITCVSNSNQDQVSTGAAEVLPSGRSLYSFSSLDVYGVDIDLSSASLIQFNTAKTTYRFEALRCDLNTGSVFLNDDQMYCEFAACQLVGNPQFNFLTGSGSKIKITGGSISTAGTWPANQGLIYPSSTLQTGSIDIESCDLSGSGIDHIIGTSFSDGFLKARIKDCRLPSLTAISGSDFANRGYTLAVTNCGQTSAEQEYQWFFKDWAGETEHNTSNYRDDTTAFPVSSQKISLVTDTTTQAVADIGRVHSFDFFTRYARLSNSDYDTITIYLSCDDALTDSEVWVDVYYPDGTNRHQPNKVSTRASNILGSGTALTSDSSTWTGGGTNKYKIVISTSSDPGGDCVPTIKVNVATQSLIYWDPVPELS